MTFSIDNLEWTREPQSCDITPDAIRITTAPHTDLWQRTYYHFGNDNAPVLQMTTGERFFSFVVKTDFADSHTRFDQCGVVVYLDSENWLKGSVEYENEAFQHLGSVVTNHGYSDWATTEIPAGVKSMWYRLSRRHDDFCIECSDDGKTFRQMRVCHLHKATGDIRFGIYACSPEESSFTAVFTNMQLTECQWQAHDGQQPDNTDEHGLTHEVPAEIAGWMNQAGCTVTICDTEGTILYMNERARDTFASHGNLVGANLMPCHSERSREMIRHMLATGQTNAYTIEKGGVRKLIYQTPWRKDGAIAGMAEISIVLPAEMPHYVRG